MQVMNPLGFHCLPNEASPDYIAYHDFHQFVAYGMMRCWLSNDPNDPNADCNFCRPVKNADVHELRYYFLSILENLIVALWEGTYEKGEGELDNTGSHCLTIDNSDENPGEEETDIGWHVTLHDDAIMLTMSCGNDDAINIWMAYEAIEDRQNVLNVLTKAEATIGDHVWPRLVRASGVEW